MIIKKGTVKSIVTNGLRIRDVNDPSIILGHLYYNTLLRRGDHVFGEVKADNRIYFTKVYRANGSTENIAGSAAVGDGSSEWITLTNEPEPNPNPDPVPAPVKMPIIEIRSEDFELGATVSADRKSVQVEFKPKT